MRLEVFVPGNLINVMNGSHGHWRARARWAKTWREKTNIAFRVKYLQRPIEPTTPKLVRFLANTWNPVDDDALGPMLKPCRDELKALGLIHDDGPASGHSFVYGQRVCRRERGVRITVERLMPVEGTNRRVFLPSGVMDLLNPHGQ